MLLPVVGWIVPALRPHHENVRRISTARAYRLPTLSGMARHEQMLAGDADRFVAHFDATIQSGSSTARFGIWAAATER